jgi:hypothetical protein
VDGDFFVVDAGGGLAGLGFGFAFVTATGNQGGGNDDGQHSHHASRWMASDGLQAGLHVVGSKGWIVEIRFVGVTRSSLTVGN